MLPIVIGHAIWLTFVIAWNVSDTRTPTVATPGAHRERVHKLVIALGMVLIVLAVRRPLPLWTNPPILAWALLQVVAAGIAFCWWARVHLGALWSTEVTRKDAHRVVDSVKARLEEEFLMGELGAAAYRDCRARTPMLVPRVPGR